MEGELEITRILYPVPVTVPLGIVALIGLVPVPMVVGEPKEPLPSDN